MFRSFGETSKVCVDINYLFIQIPLGFYLVDLDFGKERINFDLADQFCDIHIIANYTLIALLTLHILAVIIHRFIFKENILKKMI